VWNGPRAQWWGTLFPRIQAFLPARSILEIAPGFGRWTQYLRTMCQDLVVVDLSEKCINACKDRFAEFSNIEYHVNDGKSLEMVADNSVDFLFSFDSLVHADTDAIEAYLVQLADKLTPDGVGFIHHSNVGSYLQPWRSRLPGKAGDRVVSLLNSRINLHWRSQEMSAEQFEKSCRKAGLQCITQELITWGGGKYLVDCLSTFTKPTSRWARPTRRIQTPDFIVSEAMRVAAYAYRN
jgi:hypothetical protein